MENNEIYNITDKVAEVLKNFYSLHEADELTRIITDPEKSLEDVKACMDAIRQNEWNERAKENLEARITKARFLFPHGQETELQVHIDGIEMPARKLDKADGMGIGSINLNLITEEELEDMAKDLALTYYAEELAMNYWQLKERMDSREESSLTEDDARTCLDLGNTLEAKFPNGLVLGIPGFTVADLFSYVQYGKFRDDYLVFAGVGEHVPENEEYLTAQVHLPRKHLHQLVPAIEEYNSEAYVNFINGLEYAEAFDASVTELMHRHPDLQGAKFMMDDHSLIKFMHIENDLLDNAIAWVLQKPDMDESTLRKVMKDPEAGREVLKSVAAEEPDEYDRRRIAKTGMPEKMDMIRNDDYLYFFERGKLGFAVADRLRGVTYKGETMSNEVQDYINNLVLDRNIEVRGHQTFFLIPNIKSESKAYIDTMKNRLVKVDIQQDIYGNTLYTNGTKVLKEGDMQHFQDITGRIKDARITGIHNPLIRCKIDGVQQFGRKLTKSDVIKAGHFMSDSAAMDNFALSMAVKYYATDLYNNREQEQTKGMKL